MIRDFKEIITDITQQKLAPLYILTGDEPFYIDKLCKKFESEILNEEEKNFNQITLYGLEASIEQILNNVNQYPVFANVRLTIVREAQMMDKRNLSKLLIYFQKPVENSILVICYKEKETGKKNLDATFLKQAGANAVVYRSEKIKDWNLPKWIEDYCKSLSLTIYPDAARMLADYLGNNLEKIDNEISKILINIGQNEPITSNIVEKLVGISKEYNSYELQKALANKDILLANKIANYFETNEKSVPFGTIISYLHTYFSKLIIANQLKEKTDDNLKKIFNPKNIAALKYHRIEMQNYSLDKLYSIIGCLREYEMKLKGFNVPPNQSNGTLFKEMVFKILH